MESINNNNNTMTVRFHFFWKYNLKRNFLFKTYNVIAAKIPGTVDFICQKIKKLKASVFPQNMRVKGFLKTIGFVKESLLLSETLKMQKQELGWAIG